LRTISSVVPCVISLCVQCFEAKESYDVSDACPYQFVLSIPSSTLDLFSPLSTYVYLRLLTSSSVFGSITRRFSSLFEKPSKAKQSKVKRSQTKSTKQQQKNQIKSKRERIPSIDWNSLPSPLPSNPLSDIYFLLHPKANEHRPILQNTKFNAIRKSIFELDLRKH